MIRLVADANLSRHFVEAGLRLDKELPIVHLADWMGGKHRVSKDPALLEVLRSEVKEHAGLQLAWEEPKPLRIGGLGGYSKRKEHEIAGHHTAYQHADRADQSATEGVPVLGFGRFFQFGGQPIGLNAFGRVTAPSQGSRLLINSSTALDIS